MDGYISVVNDDGITQINDTYKNLVLYSVYDLAFASFTSTMCSATISSLPIDAICFLSNLGSSNIAFYGGFSGSSDTNLLSCTVYSLGATPPTGVRLYVFTGNLPEITETAGLNVYKSDGTLLFSSAYRYLRIKSGKTTTGSKIFEDYDNSGFKALETYPADKTYAVNIFGTPIQIQSDLHGFYSFRQSYIYIPANNTGYKCVPATAYNDLDFDGTYSNTKSGAAMDLIYPTTVQALAIDVTNY
jgi:hypothetical protein